ncbi:MAG: hypothetical protein GY731_05035, partial [Gammaproteobacteria bacterium]|nr:hypothetical protein [Gammaproteobacteria bacterium]
LIAYLGRQAEVGRFARLLSAVLERQPALKIWIEAHPLKLLEYGDHWPRLLAVLEYFRANPRPSRYLRELDIPGVESKFVERHRGLIAELLDSTLPPEAVDDGVSGLARHGFERRYGLKYDQPLVRFRLLDPDLAAGYGSLTDLTIPLSEFITLAPPCRQIYITENKTNGLSFPTLSGSLIVFGLGYGISTLKDIPWFREKEILYWGDIDTHGFAILSQLRGYYPQVRSLLMDRETLERFPDARGQEEDNQRFVGEPEHLDTEERVFYHQLRDNLLGERIRLEQEKIPFEYLCGKVKLVP